MKIYRNLEAPSSTANHQRGCRTFPLSKHVVHTASQSCAQRSRFQQHRSWTQRAGRIIEKLYCLSHIKMDTTNQPNKSSSAPLSALQIELALELGFEYGGITCTYICICASNALYVCMYIYTYSECVLHIHILHTYIYIYIYTYISASLHIAFTYDT